MPREGCRGSPPPGPWPPGPVVPLLEDRQVHVWLRDLEGVHPDGGPSLGLSAEELERAGRLRRKEDQRRWTSSRAWLRAVLGRYVDRPGSDLRFFYGTEGKPFLAHTPRRGPIQFNLSHSGDWAIMAVSRHEVGIDMETTGGEPPTEALVRRVLTEDEQQAMARWFRQRRKQGFLKAWTRKEALFKGTGEGLTRDPLTISTLVSESSSGGSVAFEVMRNAADYEGWTVVDLSPDPGVVAAVAVREAKPRFQAWSWT